MMPFTSLGKRSQFTVRSSSLSCEAVSKGLDNAGAKELTSFMVWTWTARTLTTQIFFGQPRPARSREPKIFFVNMRLAHSVFGNGPKRLVLAHPLASSGAFFSDVVPLLGSDFSVLTFDARGMGRSAELGNAPFTWDDLVQDTIALVDSTWGPQTRFHFAGVSMGGMLGQHIARTHHDRLLSAILVSTTASTAAQAEIWKERIAMLKGHTLLPGPLVDLALNRWFTAPCPGRDREVFLKKEKRKTG